MLSFWPRRLGRSGPGRADAGGGSGDRAAGGFPVQKAADVGGGDRLCAAHGAKFCAGLRLHAGGALSLSGSVFLLRCFRLSCRRRRLREKLAFAGQ